jgi:transglutaminase/protease-like cytokinesis protein 3
VGIQSYIIEGYTKQYGKVSSLAHAWTAAKLITSGMCLILRGAGYVNNGKFFKKKLNNSYFKVAPSVSIASHMPFDYLWQFSNYPISNNDFYEGKIQMNKTKKYFDFEKINIYLTLSEEDQLFTSAERIAKMV